MRILSTLVILFSLGILACSQAAPATPILAPASIGKTLKVVSTVSPITSLVENIGGTRIQLQGIVPEGTNSHTFEPAPSVAVVLSQTDLVVANGLFLETSTDTFLLWFPSSITDLGI